MCVLFKENKALSSAKRKKRKATKKISLSVLFSLFLSRNALLLRFVRFFSVFLVVDCARTLSEKLGKRNNDEKERKKERKKEKREKKDAS